MGSLQTAIDTRTNNKMSMMKAWMMGGNDLLLSALTLKQALFLQQIIKGYLHRITHSPSKFELTQTPSQRLKLRCKFQSPRRVSSKMSYSHIFSWTFQLDIYVNSDVF